MAAETPALEQASHVVLAEIGRVRARSAPFLVALDGGSGSGKSSIADLLQSRLDAALIRSDDFFSAGITAYGWASRSASEKARDCIDWRRLRQEALEPLLAGEAAQWQPFDFLGGALPDGSYATSSQWVRVEPRPVVILEGAYSCRPELSDVIHLSVLVDVPREMRRARLAPREDPDFLEQWHQRWDEAEAHYFAQVRPPSSFDLVVGNS